MKNTWRPEINSAFTSYAKIHVVFCVCVIVVTGKIITQGRSGLPERTFSLSLKIIFI